MKVQNGVVELSHLALSHGQAATLEVELAPRAITLAGESYLPDPEPPVARLDVSRTTGGYAFRLRFEAALHGPCARCLEPAEVPFEIDVREIDQPGEDDEELESPYVAGGDQLDALHWANDAIALAMPTAPLCRSDCAGLCPECGQTLNDADPADHRHGGGGDPRFAKLRDLKLD